MIEESGMDLFEGLTFEQRGIADAIGIEAFVLLARRCGGSSIYIPKLKSVERPDRNKKIRQEFNGYNFNELAVKYDLTETTIRTIVADIKEIVRNRPAEGQLTLFDAT